MGAQGSERELAWVASGPSQGQGLGVKLETKLGPRLSEEGLGGEQRHGQGPQADHGVGDQVSHGAGPPRAHLAAPGPECEARASRWGWGCLQHPHLAAPESYSLPGTKDVVGSDRVLCFP